MAKWNAAGFGVFKIITLQKRTRGGLNSFALRLAAQFPTILNEPTYTWSQSTHRAEAIVDKRLKHLFKWGLASVIQRRYSSSQKWLSFCWSRGGRVLFRPQMPLVGTKKTDKLGKSKKRAKRNWKQKAFWSKGGNVVVIRILSAADRERQEKVCAGRSDPTWADETWGGARDKSRKRIRAVRTFVVAIS